MLPINISELLEKNRIDYDTTDKIRALLNAIESDRIERTISTTNTDKFGQAICAFTDDFEKSHYGR